MKKPLHKILIGLTVLLLFPVAIATFYEYARINDNEELLSTVYKNQLETIISSVNSYAQDVPSNWASRLELWIKDPADTTSFNRLVNENRSITGIYIATNNMLQTVYVDSGYTTSADSIAMFRKTQSESINLLLGYYNNNYRKFLSHATDKNNVMLYFICQGKNNNPVVCFINMDLQQFLQEHISARLQSIAQENFVITLLHQPSGESLLSTEKVLDEGMLFDQEGEMWLFPQIKIGISLKKQTITDLATKRAKEGLVLAGGVMVVLIAGVWFLYTSVKQEIQLAQIKSEFISNVSHEIRTPLALISMYIETLEMGRLKTADKVQEYYGIIGKETQRLTGIVNKILSFSKMESGTRQFKFDIGDLNDITHKVMETYQFHLGNKGFDLQFSPALPLPRNLFDKETIADAIINLIDNAMKYSKDIKVIEVKTGVERNFTYIEVKDYGRGISRKNQKMVFDKFYRVTNENLANEVKGTGLGLSIVSEIVKAHKGKVTLQSKPGEGCTFRMYFPSI